MSQPTSARGLRNTALNVRSNGEEAKVSFDRPIPGGPIHGRTPYTENLPEVLRGGYFHRVLRNGWLGEGYGPLRLSSYSFSRFDH